MLVTPRTYELSQAPDRGVEPYNGYFPTYHSLRGWRGDRPESRRAAEMLLVHLAGSVRVGEVTRLKLTYTPANDPILPTPQELHVKVKNTSAIPLRAAYLHGPYTLYSACYPSDYNPNERYPHPQSEGIPQFEPYLKAGGNWFAVIPIPERIRVDSESRCHEGDTPDQSRSLTWVIEIVSQVIFSTTAAVHFEIFVGRDQKSLEWGTASATAVQGLPPPANLSLQQWSRFNNSEGPPRPFHVTKGIFSRSVRILVEDTKSLWNTPPFPTLEDKENLRAEAFGVSHDAHKAQSSLRRDEASQSNDHSSKEPATSISQGRRKKRVHFVVVTHGLHSNLGADMLFLKESIDAVASKNSKSRRRGYSRPGMQDNGASADHRIPPSAHQSPTRNLTSPDQQKPRMKENRKERRRRRRGGGGEEAGGENEEEEEEEEDQGKEEQDDNDDDSESEEQIIVRGFAGNAVRTEKGIQYLGKRLAKYVLLMTYPDQPYLPPKRRKKKSFFSTHRTHGESNLTGPFSGNDGDHEALPNTSAYGYKITSISFIGHSLGGLVQTYALAYIQKYSPQFFDRIKPINFIALATPFLGLSNENPIYVRFALDLGLVGRTGQDLGLSWTAPKVRSGWSAMIAGVGTRSHNLQKQEAPASKPLLRILPAGPAHQVLSKFRNRTVYSNVVNDGIVPLRTSCLLFLDWRGLDKVQKARRENGLVGTMAEWGWAELTGANASSPKPGRSGVASPDFEAMAHAKDPESVSSHEVAGNSAESSSDTNSIISPRAHQFLARPLQEEPADLPNDGSQAAIEQSSSSSTFGSLGNFFSLLRLNEPRTSSKQKHTKIYRRSQTIRPDSKNPSESDRSRVPRRGLVRGDSMYDDQNLNAPPRTTLLEAAGDVLRPPLPPPEFILDPSSRPRTIFHDRVYHPEDIPPPANRRRTTIFNTSRGPSLKSASKALTEPNESAVQSNSLDEASFVGGMKVEEKIARAYHKDLSWRKVLVRLEPDAHNNIIVRRMFANAYGWPVIKHLVDTHFAHTLEAETDDSMESNMERAKPLNMRASETGGEVLSEDHTSESSSRRMEAQACEYGRHDDNELSLRRPLVEPNNWDESNGLGLTVDEHSGRAEFGIASRSSEASRQDSAKWTDRYFDDDSHHSDSTIEHDSRST